MEVLQERNHLHTFASPLRKRGKEREGRGLKKFKKKGGKIWRGKKKG